MLDYLLYAPLGAVVVAAEELPHLAERGRERFERQVGAAELIGRLAVAEARRRLSALSGSSDGPVSGPQARSPLSRAISAPVDTSAPEAPQRPLPPEGDRGPKVSRSHPAPRMGASMDVAASPQRHELPIPAYDTLAASQVVERLASLTPVELEAVRKHESATRRRRTVLHRISQLNAERASATA
jgi:hypothetical protein